MSVLIEKAGKKVFEKHLEQYTPQDPLYETYTTPKGRQKRRKRAIPPGLSKRDRKILEAVRSRAHYLDKSFSIFGFRFGWTIVIGIIPFIGDAAVVGLNYYLVVRKARQADLPPWLLSRMAFHLSVGAGVGLVPVVGDIVAAMYKASSRNAALLEEFLRVRGEHYLQLEDEAAAGSAKIAPTVKISKSDAEQLKPGAGLVPGERIEGVNVASMSMTAEASGEDSNGTRSMFSFFSRSSSKKGPVKQG